MAIQIVVTPRLDEREEARDRSIAPDRRLEILVNIRASVLDVEVVRRQVNTWLLEEVGNLLSASKPELVVGERLLWRFDVILGVPNEVQPGSGAMYKVGQILLDAETGAIEEPANLIIELQANVAAIAH